MVIQVQDTPDKYAWRRRQGSKQLGIPEDQMADEPDEMLDHSDDQGWT